MNIKTKRTNNMMNLKVMNAGLNGVLTPSEFMVLYVINNGLNQNNEWKKFYLEMLSDLTGISTRQLKRIIISIEEKGFIEKRTVQVNSTKKSTTYRLNEDMINRLSNDLMDTINNQTDTLMDKANTKLEENMSQMSHYKIIKRNKNNININTIAIEKQTTGNTDDIVCNEIANSTSNEVEPNKEDLMAKGADSFNGSVNDNHNNEIEVRTMNSNGQQDNCNNVVIPSCDGNKQSSFNNEDNICTSTPSAMGITPSFHDDLDILFPVKDKKGQTETETDEWLNSIDDNGNTNSSIIFDNCSNVLTPPQSCAAPPLKNEIEATGSNETNVVEQQPTDIKTTSPDATGVAKKAWDYKDWCDRMNKLQFISGFEEDIEEFKKQLKEMDELMRQLKQHGTPEQFRRACKNIHCWYGEHNWNMNLDFVEAAINLKNKYRYTQSTCR